MFAVFVMISGPVAKSRKILLNNVFNYIGYLMLTFVSILYSILLQNTHLLQSKFSSDSFCLFFIVTCIWWLIYHAVHFHLKIINCHICVSLIWRQCSYREQKLTIMMRTCFAYQIVFGHLPFTFSWQFTQQWYRMLTFHILSCLCHI